MTENLLLAIRDEVRKKDAKFFVVTVTSAHQTHPSPTVRRAVEQRLGVPNLFYAENQIQALGEREGFAVLPHAPLFQAQASNIRSSCTGLKTPASAWATGIVRAIALLAN